MPLSTIAIASDVVDPRVGLSHILPLGALARAGEPLMQVHASSREAAQAAMAHLAQAIRIAPQASAQSPVVIERLSNG
jgi:thymidine phosphorylase